MTAIALALSCASATRKRFVASPVLAALAEALAQRKGENDQSPGQPSHLAPQCGPCAFLNRTALSRQGTAPSVKKTVKPRRDRQIKGCETSEWRKWQQYHLKFFWGEVPTMRKKSFDDTAKAHVG
jgi:hypothetical protein